MADAASLQVVVLVVDVVETDIGDAGGILDGKGSNYSLNKRILYLQFGHLALFRLVI